MMNSDAVKTSSADREAGEEPGAAGTSAATLRQGQRAVGAVVLVAATALNFGIVVHRYDGGSYLRGDCWYYYITAVCLLETRSLNLGPYVEGQLSRHATQISRSIDGRIVPKHPLVLSILSLPFIGLLGESGALAFNLLQITALVMLLYALALAVASPGAAGAAALLTYGGTFLPHYVWNFSPDVCGSCFIAAAALAAMRAARPSAWFTAGFLCAVAAAARYPLLLLVPLIPILSPSPSRAGMVAWIAGTAIPLGGLALLDLHLFGSPFATGYDRILRFTTDLGPVIYSQRAAFDLPLTTGASGQLFDPRHGLLFTSPVTMISMCALPLLLGRERRIGIFVAAASLALFLLFAGYREWDASHYGNRFLMPVVALGVLPLAAGLEALRQHVSRRPSPHDPRSAARQSPAPTDRVPRTR